MVPAGARAAAPSIARAPLCHTSAIPYASAIAPAGPDFEAARPDFSEAAGPDFSEAAGPDFSEAAGPDFSEAAGPDFSEDVGPDFSEAVGPDFSEATEPNVKRCRGGPLDKDCLCRYKIDTAISV